VKQLMSEVMSESQTCLERFARPGWMNAETGLSPAGAGEASCISTETSSA
jgi:hypothetical protein